MANAANYCIENMWTHRTKKTSFLCYVCEQVHIHVINQRWLLRRRRRWGTINNFTFFKD